ncbi:peptidylprolyl isomerase [Sphingomonas montanisoli]|uniref:Parvulin-like PPIase n=1 Tax=Sphingomonas montanisoli TaxID=2606412 RepID=A0A5D9C0X5_9SPHN|nr:peptidylprolyl isomerase [Sphingomonas montanisoli]TZG24942.1 hypothetical protein FYJ91_16840 [Sphingomonas montanisoli]
MISFFRRALSSWLVLGLLGLILVAFIVTGVSTPSSLGAGDGGTTVAKVGGKSVSSVELIRRAQNELEAQRRQQPGVDQRAFIANGGFDRVTTSLIGARAIDVWGKEAGFAISKRLVDAEIASIPAFRGVTGQFDQAAMRQILSQQRITERDLRNDIAGDLLRNQALSALAGSVMTPTKVASPYASLLVEKRLGRVAIIPLAAVADTRTPTDAEVAAFYKARIANYTQPETRVLRYALFGAEQVAAKAKPSDADIAAYYQEHSADYAARESRDLSQLIVPTQAQANAIAAKAKSGGTLADAAKASGLEAAELKDQSKAAFAGSANAAIADAVFAAPAGGVIGPVKAPLGWYVVKVAKVGGVPAKSLAEARPEIEAALVKDKADNALADLSSTIEGAIADGASFEEVAKNNNLTVVTTPPVLATGAAPSQPGWKAPPELAALLKSGFEAAAEDDPTVETVVPNQRYAMLGVSRVIAPTPIPLATVRAAVGRDIVVDRTAKRAQQIATTIRDKVKKGMTLEKAVAEAGVKLPPVQPAAARQLDLSRIQPDQIPAPVRALFRLSPGKVTLAPDTRSGALFVVVLDKIEPADLKMVPGLVEQTRGELANAQTGELVEQFVNAVGQDIGTSRDAAAIAEAKKRFVGQ